jgi:hypothetical protein
MALLAIVTVNSHFCRSIEDEKPGRFSVDGIVVGVDKRTSVVVGRSRALPPAWVGSLLVLTGTVVDGDVDVAADSGVVAEHALSEAHRIKTAAAASLEGIGNPPAVRENLGGALI